MKNLFILLFITMFITPAGYSQSIPISANIINSISYNSVVAMDFGNCAVGTDQTSYVLSVLNGITKSGIGSFNTGTTNSGRIHFMGSPGVSAQLTIQFPGGMGDVSLSDYTYATCDNSAYSGLVSSNYTNGSSVSAIFSSGGDIYLSLGAKLTVSKSTSTPGTKSSNIIVTCIYQ